MGMNNSSTTESLNWRRELLALLICYTVLSAFLMFPNTLSAQGRQDSKGQNVRQVNQLPSREKRWALIIGVDEYEKDVSALKGAVNDAKALKEVLVKYAGFPEDQVILLTTDAANPDQLPRRANILDELNKLSYRVPEDGLLLFSFSGHGASVGKDAYLIPSDGRITKNLKLLRDFSIDVQRIKETIEEIKVKQVLMFLDACRNEPGKGEMPNPLTEAYRSGFRFDVVNSEVKAFATLYATSIGERAFEFYDQGTRQYRGYFSYAIEEGMRGKAVNANGAITLGGLINYVENTVPRRVRFDKGENQEPFKEVAGYKESELILAIGVSISAPLPVIKTAAFRELARNLLRYNEIESSSDDLLQVRIGNFIEGKSGFIDKTGKVVIPLQYDLAFSFAEGLAGVSLNGKSGFIDKTGKVVIPLTYDAVISFTEGLARVRIGDLVTGKWGFIDKTGKLIIPAKYRFVGSFAEGLAGVSLNGKSGFIDKTGKVVIPLTYAYVGSFAEGLAVIRIKPNKTGSYGFIDKTGEVIIPITYDDVDSFAEGLAGVSLNGKRGFIDKTGEIIIPITYDDVDSFAEGLAKVGLNGKSGFIDKTGKVVIPAKYDSVWCEAFRKDGIIGVILNGKKGFVDIYGNEYFDF